MVRRRFAIHAKQPVDNRSVEGTLTAGFDRLVPCRSYAIGLEFGTCSPLRVLNAMRYDYWYHHNASTLSMKYKTRARQKNEARVLYG
jgi:hypothetical protein